MIKILILCFFLCFQISQGQWVHRMKGIKLEEEIDFNGYPLKDVLFYLSRESNSNIIGDSSTEGIVLNMSFQRGTNLYQVLEGINRANGLKVKKVENILILSKRISNIIDERTLIGRIVDRDYDTGVDGAKISFLNGNASPVFTKNGGYFVAESLDPGVYLVNVEKNGYHSEGDLVEVKPGMEKAVIKIARDVQSRMNREEEPIYHDQVKQVRITAQMLDVTDNLFEDLGFSWIYGANEKNYKNNAINVGIFEKGAVESMGVIYPLSVGFVKTFNSGQDILNLAINLLQATQDLVVSAVPTILVLDGHEGEFKITEEVIAGQSRVRYDDEDETIYTPIFKEAGTIIRVKPVIHRDGTIQMNLKVEVSNFKLRKSIKEETEEVNGGTFNENGGSKVSRSIETIVRIGDGETIFIGGLKRAVSHSGTSKVPMIGDVPVVGVFFKNQTVRNEVTDLFIKLKADIVGAYNTDESNEEQSREIGRIYPKIK